MLLVIVLILLNGAALVLTRLLKAAATTATGLPKCYPIIGHLLSFSREDLLPFIADILGRFVVHVPFLRSRTVLTANPHVIRHLLKDNFRGYDKGHDVTCIFRDILGEGILNVDGASWKSQRQVASQEFNTRSLRRFVEKVVDAEVSDRLIPLMAQAAADGAVFDLQNVMQRFGFDNICKIAFGYDSEYLSLPLSNQNFDAAFDDAMYLTSLRFNTLFPIKWKIKKLIGYESEKRLKEAVSIVRGFAMNIITQKKQEMMFSTKQLQEEDLLSRFLKSGHSDEQFAVDIVINFIFAGRDSTSTVLTWFFWLLSKSPRAELKVLEEIRATTCKADTMCIVDVPEDDFSPYEETKEMVYTHACLCEAMRLYPPIPLAMKEAVHDDIFPDGTRVKRGDKVIYYAYVMGRLEKIWGRDWEEFKPERWLQKDEEKACKWKFVGRNPYEYPVFNAGPRICMGKDFAFLQMMRVISRVMRRFKVVSMLEVGVDPIYVYRISTKMKGGLPVRFEERKVTI